MRIRLATLAVLCAATLLAASVSAQEKNEAEQLFRKMEEKLDKAKAIDLAFDVTVNEDTGLIPKGIRFKGTLAAMSGNKGRMELIGKTPDGKSSKIQRVSDGTKAMLIISSDGGGGSQGNTPKNLTATWLTLVARSGVLMSIMPLPPAFGKEGLDYKDGLLVSSFKLGKQEKVGERLTQQISYVLEVKGDANKFPVTLWIDLKTGLPAKRQIGALYSESYKLTLNGKLDAKKFELPK